MARSEDDRPSALRGRRVETVAVLVVLIGVALLLYYVGVGGWGICGGVLVAGLAMGWLCCDGEGCDRAEGGVDEFAVEMGRLGGSPGPAFRGGVVV